MRIRVKASMIFTYVQVVVLVVLQAKVDSTYYYSKKLYTVADYYQRPY